MVLSSKASPAANAFSEASMRLTEIDVAEAQIRAAVWMFFREGHPVPVYTLANAAREIVASIGKNRC